MNYKIIADESKILEFSEWLPACESHEMFFGMFLFRRKYLPENLQTFYTNKDNCLKKFTFTKENLIQKLKKLESPIGSYQSNELDVLQDGICVYCFPNPRDLKKATINLSKKLIDILGADDGYYNIHNHSLTEIQKSKGTKHWIDFDIDDKSFDLEIFDKYKGKAGKVLETKNGYHLLINSQNLDTDLRNSFYQDLRPYADKSGDGMVPIPGTFQSDFVPSFV